MKDAYERLLGFGDESIYSGDRLAQPDEVWNFNTGDGLEKALTLVNIARNRGMDAWIETSGSDAKVLAEGEEFLFRRR